MDIDETFVALRPLWVSDSQACLPREGISVELVLVCTLFELSKVLQVNY